MIASKSGMLILTCLNSSKISAFLSNFYFESKAWGNGIFGTNFFLETLFSFSEFSSSLLILSPLFKVELTFSSFKRLVLSTVFPLRRVVTKLTVSYCACELEEAISFADG